MCVGEQMVHCVLSYSEQLAAVLEGARLDGMSLTCVFVYRPPLVYTFVAIKTTSLVLVWRCGPFTQKSESGDLHIPNPQL